MNSSCHVQLLFLGTAVYDGRVAVCDDGFEYQPIAVDEGALDAKKMPMTVASLSKYDLNPLPSL